MENKELAQTVQELQGRVDKLEAKNSKLTMVLFSGDFDKVMAAFIIANGALAMGKEVTMFVTFWGLDAIKEADYGDRREEYSGENGHLDATERAGQASDFKDEFRGDRPEAVPLYDGQKKC